MAIIFTRCSNSTNRKTDDDSAEDHFEKDKNVLKFIETVKENDAEALFDLIEIRHEEDVYWTVKEAGDLIEYLSQSESTMRDELRNLGISHDSLLEDPYNSSEMPDEYII